jgi:Coenzyme PQQ synthesis protein D (PqqD)
MAEHYLPRARRSKLVVRELADETLVYDVEGHRAHCLNRTAALVWNLCDGENTVPRIAEKMCARLSARVPDEVVRLALDQLADRGLLAPADVWPAAAKAVVPRRAMVRRLGLAAAVALPLVTSIISPTPVMAQSPCNETSCPPGTTCQAGVCEPEGV